MVLCDKRREVNWIGHRDDVQVADVNMPPGNIVLGDQCLGNLHIVVPNRPAHA